MREINIEIIASELKEKLGIKDVDFSSILDSLSQIKKSINDNKFSKENTDKIYSLLNQIAEKKDNNTDIIKAINELGDSINSKTLDSGYDKKFDKLIEAIMLSRRTGYNSYDPKIRNQNNEFINPATSEKQDAIISAIQNTTSTAPTYTLRLAESGNYTYIGEAEIGSAEASALWRVQRVDKTSGVVILFAGTGVFDQVWDDYLTLTYA